MSKSVMTWHPSIQEDPVDPAEQMGLQSTHPELRGQVIISLGTQTTNGCNDSHFSDASTGIMLSLAGEVGRLSSSWMSKDRIRQKVMNI